MNCQILVNKHQRNRFILNEADGANKFDNFVVLSVWNEFKGICRGYEINEFSILIFIDEKVIKICKDETMVTLLKNQDVVGKRIGILRTDIPRKDYLFRLLEEWE